MNEPPAVSGSAVARGVVWRIVEVMGTEVLAFGAFVMLARLLVPDEFGLVSQATLFILATQLVLQQGLPEALVQKDDIGEAHVDSCFWANLAIGTAAAALLALAAPLVALAVAEPELTAVLVALSPTLILLAASRIILAKLRRELRFRGFMALNLSAVFAGALTATVMAFAGFGVWSLVSQQWVYALAGLIAGCLAAGWRPRFRFDPAHLREMWAFSSFTVLEALLAFCARRLDLLILALFWSAREIGYYFLANRLLFSAGMLTYYSISHLGLPFLARLADDPDAHRAAAYRTLRLASLACLPTLIGLALVAPLLIPLLFGDEWAPSVMPFQALAGFGIVYALTLVSGQILISAGHARDAMALSGVTMLLFLAAVTLAAPHGITWAAVAGGMANAAVIPIYLHRLRHHFGISARRALREQVPCWLATGIMAAVVLGMESWLAAALSPAAHLVAACLIGALTFVAVMIVLARDDLIEIRAAFAASGDEDEPPPASSADVASLNEEGSLPGR